MAAKAERSPNFGFLADGHDPVFHDLALAAERVFPFDPSTTLVKLRQLAEAFAKEAAAACSIPVTRDTKLLDLIRALEGARVIEREVADLFHQLRVDGNRAAHDFAGSHQEALDQLRLARKLAIWFHKTFGGPNDFKAGPFVSPPDPTAKLRELETQLAEARADAESAKKIASTEAARASAETAARAKAEAEREEWERFAVQVEADAASKLKAFEARIAAETDVSRVGMETPDAREAVLAKVVGKSAFATAHLDLDEEETRVLIDRQLRAVGWQVDSRVFRYRLGSRPEKGKLRAIAEWPTKSGPADYVLFDGLAPVAVIEAKRKAKNVRAAIEQAKRYALGLEIEPPLEQAKPFGAPEDFQGWPTTSEKKKRTYYRVPFLYSTNGRPYLRQLETESGTWFLDARQPTNHPRALDGWHGPNALREMLAADVSDAEKALKQEPTDYLGLRPYQLRAIDAVEHAVARDQRSMLLAMATGTGKTRTVIGLIYRLLKAKRFRRVLFLVDRSALGEQAQNAFKEMRLENMQTFSEIYEVKELADQAPEPETKVHVATVQGMVKRILYANSDADAVPIDRYDCIIVDESHRGYTLDREMTEGEMELRSFSDYVSTYRRVLDHFDAVKVGLTATPALHTRDIFGDPIFTYSYREAVVDGWLIDHEPPMRIKTKLAQTGIHFAKGSEVATVVRGDVQLSTLPDELDFDVDAFNRNVITEGFNKVVCEELAKHIDPTSDAKTLVYCANDRHADLFVDLLKKALEVQWGALDDAAVAKITGSVDRPLEAIRRYKNEKLPNIAVTVDLLTTGIDVPPISNLVFVRRVRSRILYEQMLGRATRRCDEIGKSVFRIFDAVDLYSALEPFTSMKPVVKSVNVSLRRLVDDLVALTLHQVADGGSLTGEADSLAAEAPSAQDALDQVVAKLRRAIRAEGRTSKEGFGATSDSVESIAGVPLKELPERLQELGPVHAAEIFRLKPELIALLERLSGATGGQAAVIAPHADEIVGVSHGYGEGRQKPADYLDAFGRFITENMNKLPALSVVVQRPRSLTREQLRELRLKLDFAGFSEPNLQAAWRDLKNEDIAATIVGFIRQRALGSPLVPYEERVERAVKRTLASRQWTLSEKKWLERIGEQLKKEVVVDAEAMNKGAFANHGGYKGVDKALGGRLAQILDQLGDGIWEDAAAAAG